MKTSHLKIYIAYTFLAIFLSLKVAGLHVLTHDDSNTNHCEICDIVSTNNLSPAINDTAQDYVGCISDFYFRAKVIRQYSFVYSASINIDSLFSRPPPFSI